MLTPRSIQVLKHILLNDQTFTFRKIADELDLSEKTVRNQLDEIQDFLVRYHLTLKTIPGTGSMIVGTALDRADAYAEILDVHHANPLIRNKDRLFIILYRLLNSDRPCYVHELEDILYVSRSSLYKDLKEVENWLSKMKIGLIINRKKGISLMTGEKRTRLALVKLLSEISLEFMTLYASDLQEYLLSTIIESSDHGQAARLILQKLERESGLIFEPEEVDRLRLNLLITFDRIRQGHTVSLTAEVLSRLQNTLWVKYLANCLTDIKHGFGIELSPNELYYLSGIFLSSKSKPIEPLSHEPLIRSATTIAQEFTKLVTDIIKLPKASSFTQEIEAHILSVLQKSQYIWECVNPIKTEIKAQFPNSYLLAQRITPLFQTHAGLEINDDEVAYIAMHIMSALEQARRPLKTVFVFDKTPSEVRYAISMIKNHIAEVKIIKIVQTKEITLELIDESELILSSYPLPKSITKANFTVPLIPDNRYLNQLKGQIALLYEKHNDERIIGKSL